MEDDYLKRWMIFEAARIRRQGPEDLVIEPVRVCLGSRIAGEEPMQKMELAEMPTEALEAELQRRRDEAAALRRQKNEQRRAAQLKLLQLPGFLDALVPEHGRTSCSDENPLNGWGARSDGGHRCWRCALLQGGFPEGYHLTLDLNVD
jgi:hypothetical protein